MTASATATAFLRRAAGLAAVLGIIAGILGIHVIASSHSAHSAPAVSTVLPGVVSPADDASIRPGAGAHSPHSAPDPAAAHSDAAHREAESAPQPCSGCTSAETTTVLCTPSAKSGSLTAPLPGSTVFGAVPGAGHPAAIQRGYSYLPGSPSPGELSISRT